MNTLEKRQKLAELNRQAKSLSEQIEADVSHCQHEWGDTVYDPIQVAEQVFDHIEPHGSDPDFIYKYTGRMIDRTPRWKQTCKVCGHTRYTEKTKIIGREPDFDK